MFKFLEKIQNSDEQTKRIWMFVLTVISMGVVIFVWLAYFNNLVSSFEQPVRVAEEPSGFTFWQTMKKGMNVVYGEFMNKLRFLGETLSAPKEYIISPT